MDRVTLSLYGTFNVKHKQIAVIKGSKGSEFFFKTSPWHSIVFNAEGSFHINKIEDVRESLKLPFPPFRRDCFYFLFFSDGNQIGSKGLETYIISKNTFFFVPAYQISSIESISKDAKGYYCHFDIDLFAGHLIQPMFLNQFPFLHFGGNPVVQLDQQIIGRILFVLQRIEQEYTSDNTDNTIISTYLAILFLELKPFCAVAEKVKENAAYRVTNQYKRALEQYIYEKQTIESYANMLAITPDYLNKCVKATTGLSANQLLSEMILIEVKALLKQTSLSVGEIAFKIGKEDISEFSRFFKSKTGITPTQYRKLS